MTSIQIFYLREQHVFWGAATKKSVTLRGKSSNYRKPFYQLDTGVILEFKLTKFLNPKMSL